MNWLPALGRSFIIYSGLLLLLALESLDTWPYSNVLFSTI